MARSSVILGILVLLTVGPFTQPVRGQETARPPLVISKSPTRLVDHFGILPAEDRSARFDSLFQEISQSPGSVGYALLYCGKKCKYGEIEAHQRGIEIKIAMRAFDRRRIVVLNAGFRERLETELWISVDPSVAPTPKSTVNIRFVDFSKSTKEAFESYECCDDYSDVWKNLKP